MKKVFAVLMVVFLMLSVVAFASTNDNTVMSKGSKGEEVKAVQERLIELDYLDDVADGVFGGKTEKAVAEFQTVAGIDATGVIDKTTMQAILADDAPFKPYETAYGISFNMTFDEIDQMLRNELKDDDSFSWNGSGNIKVAFADTQLYGVSSINRYLFKDENLNDLIAVRYLMCQESEDTFNVKKMFGESNKSISYDYIVVTEALKNELGEPYFNLYLWDSDSMDKYGDSNADVDKALFDGNLFLYDEWKKDNVIVIHQAKKEDDGYVCDYVYMYDPQDYHGEYADNEVFD